MLQIRNQHISSCLKLFYICSSSHMCIKYKLGYLESHLRLNKYYGIIKVVIKLSGHALWVINLFIKAALRFKTFEHIHGDLN